MAARFCPQCGQEISSVAKFCPHCGMNLVAGATAVGPPATRMDAAARGTRRLLLPLTVVVLVVLAVAVAVLANRLHQDSLLSSRTLPMPSAMPLTNTPTAPIPAAAPLTNAPSTPAPAAPPLTNAPSNGPGQLPPDVAAYVKFLQGIEERRVALSNDTSGAMAMLSTAHQMQDEQQEAQQEENTDPDAPSGRFSFPVSTPGLCRFSEPLLQFLDWLRESDQPTASCRLKWEYWRGDERSKRPVSNQRPGAPSRCVARSTLRPLQRSQTLLNPARRRFFFAAGAVITFQISIQVDFGLICGILSLWKPLSKRRYCLWMRGKC
jgi:hypothetical protein